MARDSMRIAIAIVIAGGLVGVGIYAGLRDRTPPRATGATPALASPMTALPSAMPGPSGVVAPPDLEVRVAEQCRLALEVRRPIYTATCWAPIVADGGVADGGLNQSAYRFVLTLDAAGKETRREVRLTEKLSREDVATCLRTMKDAPLAIAAPGRETTVSVELAFP